MSPAVRLTARAEEDLFEARGFYRSEAPHVEESFETEIARSIERIAGWPTMYQAVEGEVRRAVVRRFPYSVYYRVLQDWIEVIAILHQSRAPLALRDRLE